MQVNKLFGVDAPDSFAVDVRPVDPSVPATAYPAVDPSYKFDINLLKKVMLFLLMPRTVSGNMMLFGDTGCGKSSLILQVAARLGIPVFGLACSGKTRLASFLGGYTLVNGNTVWNDGPLLMAMHHGGVCLADEVTRLDYGEQMALAPVLDGGRITVPETGEAVVAQSGFHFVGTGNSSGYGDETGAYNGEKVASSAFIDRFTKIKIEYPDEATELAILEAKVPTLGRVLSARMVKFANGVRAAFVGSGGDLRTVVTTRSLVAWALATVNYDKFGISDRPIEAALQDVVLAAAPADERSALNEIWTRWQSPAATADPASPF